jgi:hypothetical protein
MWSHLCPYNRALFVVAKLKIGLNPARIGAKLPNIG